MRFLLRGLFGLVLMAATFALIGYGAFRFYEASNAEKPQTRRDPGERSYSVNVARFEPQSVRPVTTAYGEIESWRTLQIRASSEGRLVEVAASFRDGAAVSAGDLLLKIDPADAEFNLLDAEAALADAEAQKAEAEEAIVGAEQELVASKRQLELGKQALDRQRQLRERGYSTAAQEEAEELSVAAAEQSVSNRLQSVITARKRIERMNLTVERARIALQDAERVLAETTVRAPFYGYLSGVDATLGRRVSPSETLAQLIDPTALEAKFSVSTSEFARLLDETGKLVNVPVKVVLRLGEREMSVSGRIERAAAIVADGEAGRMLYASLDIEYGTVLRPGDFVRVEIEEPELDRIAVVPAAAATADGRMLVIGEDNRLQEISVAIQRRMADELVVSGVPFGTAYVREILPQLGSGLKVQPRFADDAPSDGGGQRNERPGQGGGELVALEPAKRAALIKQVETSDLPERRKARLLALLNEPMVPKQLVERLEQGRGRRG